MSTPNHQAPANQMGSSASSWDEWGNWQPQMRPYWEIPRKTMDDSFKFDGEMSQYKPWKSRARDHCSEEWSYWRDVLDHAERVPHELKSEALNNMQRWCQRRCPQY